MQKNVIFTRISPVKTGLFNRPTDRLATSDSQPERRVCVVWRSRSRLYFFASALAVYFALNFWLHLIII